MNSVYIGIDLGTSLKRKSTGLAYVMEKNSMPVIESPPTHLTSDESLIRSAIIQISENFKSRIVAIDAPLSRPDHGTMRECEKRLRKHGIACFPSGAKWVRKWVDKGIALKEWAEKELSAEVIEVYPYAARLALDVGADVKKKTRKGRVLIQEGLVRSIGGLREMTAETLLSDDELDAVLSAYTAYLYEKGNAFEIDGSDGVIYLPLKKGDHRINEYSIT
jgi:predicted nuclease with RNAse H fold